MSGSRISFGEPLAVRPACHARISFDIAAPRQAELIIEHRRVEHRLARECRPLTASARDFEFKTHPEASHVVCGLKVRGRPIKGVQFTVDCGQHIEPIRQHFIVIGAMKAGTTTLFEMLAQHPALCQTWAQVQGLSTMKEINYFRKLYREGDTPLHYDWRFPFDRSRHAWTLDVSPGYAQWPGSKGVSARIASLNGNIKLAYILRDPIDRIESHLAHKLQTRAATTLQHCIRTSRYAMQLDKFTAHFHRDDILLLDFEELRRDPASVLAQVCDFLAIDRVACPSMVHNRRGVEFRLDAKQHAELAEAVRLDVQRLINLYGFKAAEGWLKCAA